MKKFIVYTIFISCIFTSLQAQTGKLFTTDNDLSNSLINTIYQDSRNYIWIATEDGLNKFDGIKFTIYRNENGNIHSLKNNYVRSLFEDSKGRFWVGLVNGLMNYDRGNNLFTEIPLYFGNKIIEPHVSSIIETKKGEILISTSSDAILKYDPKNNRFNVDNQLLTKLCSRYIVSVFEDSKQNLWIASADKGVNCYNQKTGKIKLFNAPVSLGNNQISSIIEDDNGSIFVGTLSGGLFKLNPDLQRFEPVSYLNNVNNLPIKTLYFDKNKRLLIGTDGRGVKIYNPKTNHIEDFEVQSATFDFSHTKVHSILLDKVGNTWIGLFQKGVFLSPNHTNKFKYYGSKSFNNNIIGSNCVMSLYKDNSGSLWVGTDHDGIYAIDNFNHSHHYELRAKSSTISSTIMSILEGDNNTLWFGSYLDGLMKFNKNSGSYTCFTNTRTDISNNPSINRVICLTKDNKNRLWIGTNGGGVQIFDIATSKFIGQYVSNVNNKGGIVTNWINCFANDGDSLIWIGTYEGVNSVNLRTGKIQTFTKKDKLLFSNIVYSIAVDKHDNVWFGTSDGLTKYNKKSHKSIHYSTIDGLPSNVIRGIVVDEKGDLWMSTHNGISKLIINENKFVNHFAFDGLQGNEFSLGAAFKANNGELFFGGVGGVTSFFPSKVINQKDSIQIFLTGLYVLDKPIVMGQNSGSHEIIDRFISDVETIQLSYDDNMFSLEFSTFNFVNSERVFYRYKLEGLNSQWINTNPGTNRISFTNLDYGRYTLRVKACVNENVSVEKIIQIRIYPPWYLTLFAKLIYLLFFIVLIYWVFRYIKERMQYRNEMIRREHIEQINEEKLQFFINISHEIRTPMTLIIGPLEKLMSETSNADQTKAYQLMYRNAQRILRLINQLLDLRKIDKGLMLVKMKEVEIVGFIEEILKTFEYQSTKRAINLEFQHDLQTLKTWIDINNLDKVLVNVLSNAFKFTPEKGEIKIKLSEGSDPTTMYEPLKNYFEIIISDNGPGIDEDKIEKVFERFYQIDHSQKNLNVGTGIGLHLSRNLIQLQHGIIFARNRQDIIGSEFVIRMPLGYIHLTDEEKEFIEDQNSTAEFRSINDNFKMDESLVSENKIRPKTKYRVLIVDDEPEIRQYLKQNLSDTYKLFESENGKEALDFILKEKPDLVISDVMMPEMDGIALCKKLKSNININHIPIILLTSNASEEDQAEGFEIGADAYVPKPFNMDLLKKHIANIIENRGRLENKIMDAQGNKDLIKPIKLRSNDQILLEKIIKIINENIDNSDLNVEMLADGVGMSRVHMHRKLKELTNQSARDFIKSIRLKQAAELITNQKLTVSEVAYALGFSNLSHFSSTFKEFYGMSPKEFAQQHWKGDKESTE